MVFGTPKVWAMAFQVHRYRDRTDERKRQVSTGRYRLRRTGTLLLLVGVLSGCDLLTGSQPQPRTIAIFPSVVTFDAIGSTQSLSAEVRDQNDQILQSAVVQWSSSDAAIASVSEVGRVTATGNGVATITASAGTASGSIGVSVIQLATVLEKVSGDGQVGAAGEPLTEPLVVQAFDRFGNPALGVPIEFQIAEGGGALASALLQTDVQGRASTSWTLGSLAGKPQSVRGFLSFRVGEGVTFGAGAVAGPPATIVIVSGDEQAAPRLSTLSDPLVVRVEDRFQNASEETTVEFAVIEGQGSVQPNSAITGPEGVASALWKLGALLGDQSVSVAVGSLSPALFSAIATISPEQLQILGGDGQLGTVGERLTDAPSVRVLGLGGAPVSSLDVRFSVSENGGMLEPPGGGDTALSVTVRTDEAGIATVGGWILGPGPGLHSVGAEVPGLPAVTLTATALTGPPASVVKISGDGQVGVVGTLLTAPLVAQVTDVFGNPVAGTRVDFAPALGSGSVDPAQVTTDGNGNASTQWILGSSQGPQSATASIDAGASTIFGAVATGEDGIEGLSIELHFVDQPTISQRQSFDEAASRWSELIPGELDPVPVQLLAEACGTNSPAVNEVVDGLLVFVRLEVIDGIAGTLGQAGLCSVRASSGLPLVARLILDRDDVARLELGGRLVDLIQHELGHALGFGTLWAPKGLLANPSLPANIGADTHFKGAAAIAAFDALGGSGYTGGQKVPVENQEGGAGTRDSHWRSSVLLNELMTGFLTTGANPLSGLTVASLGDLGYLVDEQGADVFQLNLAPPAAAPGEEQFPLGDDVLRAPIYVVDSDGRIQSVIED